MVKYVIGSGWWCSSVEERSVNPERKLLGADRLRAVDFFQLWLDSVRRCTSPAAIVVIDSCSPKKPDPELRSAVSWVELPFNAKHSTKHLGQWSGVTRSHLMSGYYALNSDAEYFVYVEQDCLLEGEEIIEHCISHMKTDLMFGDGEGTPQPTQQSLFIVRRKGLARFLNNLISLRANDRDLSPEWKFVFASWWPLVVASNLGLLKNRYARKLALRIARYFFYDHLPIGSGRKRPLPCSTKYLYFQHGTQEEITDYLTRANRSFYSTSSRGNCTMSDL